MADKDAKTDEPTLEERIAMGRSTAPDHLRPLWRALADVHDLAETRHKASHKKKSDDADAGAGTTAP